MTTPLFRSLCVCAVSAGLCGPIASGANLLQNPGFEELDSGTGFASHWQPVYWSNPHGTVEVSSAARSGQRAAKLVGIPRDQIRDIGKRNNHLVSQTLQPFRGMRTLVLSCYLRTEGDCQAFCSFITHDANGQRLQYSSSRTFSREPVWTELVWRFTTAPETDKLVIYLRNDGDVGTAWFDDLRLESTGEDLENDSVRIVIDPMLGGRVRSFLLQQSGAEKTVWQGIRPGGFCADILPAGEYPGLSRTAYESEVLEPGRRMRLRAKPSTARLAGVILEKEYVLAAAGAALSVHLRAHHAGAEAVTIDFRPQHCVAPHSGVFTWPSAGGLRVYRRNPDAGKGEISIDQLTDGWVGAADPVTGTSVVFVFDRDCVQKAYSWFGAALGTIEWYYRPVVLQPGKEWRASYLIVALPTAAPTVSASADFVFGLSPVSGEVDDAATLTVTAVRSAGPVDVRLGARLLSGQEATTAHSPTLTPGQPASIMLPWRLAELDQLRVTARAANASHSFTFDPGQTDGRRLYDLPEPPDDMGEYPGSTGFFPFGEYMRGTYAADVGDVKAARLRNLKTYRRNYFNTLIVGEGYLLGDFKKDGSSWLGEELRKLGMRAIPKGEMMRRFERDSGGGIQKEVVEANTSRESLLEKYFSNKGFNVDLRGRFAREYGDVLAAYDISDEPGPAYVPRYLLLLDIFRGIDPDHAATTILNLSRTEWLPYLPVYYGDEYPIRIAGRDPWEVGRAVRRVTLRTRAPVWVMLQAFGGRDGYTWILPNAAEARLMTYAVVANGGKGITYHGSFSPPCWRYQHHYFDTFCDSWGAATDAWAAIGEAGRHLTAIGPCLLQTDLAPDVPVDVDCEQIELTENTYHYKGPALEASVLKERGGPGRFVVVLNQDVQAARHGRLRFDRAVATDTTIADLHALQAIDSAGNSVALELAPGDCRIYYLAPDTAVASMLDAVHRHHCGNERVLLDLDLDLAVKNGVDTGRVQVLVREAVNAIERGTSAEAHRTLIAARNALTEQMSAAEPLGSVLRQLHETLDALTDIAEVFRDHFNVLMPKASRPGAARYKPWENRGNTQLQHRIDTVAAAFRERLEIEDKLYLGRAKEVAERAAKLRDTALRLRDEVIPYVLSHSKAEHDRPRVIPLSVSPGAKSGGP